MKDIFWSLFEKSGSIDAFMAYEDFKKYNEKKKKDKFREQK